jgi:ubiquinone/menaquinone biosynthesis C-methylase UbiE
MLDRARAKAMARGRPIDFYLGDAERIADPDNSYDVAITRHLVWTLVDPVAAFVEWRRVLKPGGVLLIVDGDFVTTSRLERLLMQLDQVGRNWGLLSQTQPHLPPHLIEAHRSILSRVHFSKGARAKAVVDLLERAGFAELQIDTDLVAIHRAQARRLGLFKGLARVTQHRYAIRAVRSV